MPPPIDNDLYFGNFALVRWCRDEDYVDLTVDDWKKVYNKLFEFEDLSITAEDDANESDELDEISPSMKTKHGYLKDGFVVDSNEDEEESEDDDDDDDNDDVNVKDSDDEDEDDDVDNEAIDVDNWNDDDDDDDDEDDESLDLEGELGSELRRILYL